MFIVAYMQHLALFSINSTQRRQEAKLVYLLLPYHLCSTHRDSLANKKIDQPTRPYQRHCTLNISPLNSNSSLLSIYTYKTKTFEVSTNFHVSTILKKKKHKTKKKKRNKSFLKSDALPFPCVMLYHLYPAFLYQLLLDQTHGKPTASITSHLKTHRHESFEKPNFFLSNISYAL